MFKIINKKGILKVAWQQNLKDIFDNAGVTDKSKIYTPFTTFCVFFALYYNSDTLLHIWLETDLDKKSSALKVMTESGLWAWLGYLSKVVLSALGMTTVYAFGQAIAAGLWSFGHRLNVVLSVMADDKKYKLKTEYDELEVRLEKARSDVEYLKNKVENTLKQFDSQGVQYKRKADDDYKLIEKLHNDFSQFKEGGAANEARLQFIHSYIESIARYKTFSTLDIRNELFEGTLMDYAIQVAFNIRRELEVGHIFNIDSNLYSSKFGEILALFSSWQGGSVRANVSTEGYNFTFNIDEKNLNLLSLKLDEASKLLIPSITAPIPELTSG